MLIVTEPQTLTLTQPQQDGRATRYRTCVREFTNAGARCIIYPPFASATAVDITARTKANGIDFEQLAIGTPLDVLVARNNEGLELVGVESPAVHRFDLKKRFPNGLDCVTATIETPAAGIYHAVTAKFARSGKETLYRITSLTAMFQAQDNETLRQRIYHGLKIGDSVNLWIEKDAVTTVTGYEDAREAFDVQFMSVNYR